jgi:hypothetical protein
MKLIGCLIGLSILTASGLCYALIQRIYNNATEPASGRLIYRSVFQSCKPDEFDIAPGHYKDINSAFCLIREITIGSGPYETFIRGSDLKGWNNTIYLTKSEKGTWKALLMAGIS